MKAEGGRNARFCRLRKDLLSQMASATAFDTVERGVDLVCTIDGDINYGVLVDIPQGKVGSEDELFGLEACGGRQSVVQPFSFFPIQSTRRYEVMMAAEVNDVGNESRDRRTCGDEHPPLVHLYTLRYDPIYDVGHRRSYARTRQSPHGDGLPPGVESATDPIRCLLSSRRVDISIVTIMGRCVTC